MSVQMYAQTQPIESGEKDQEEEDFDSKKWKDRIVVGGNLGAQFGNATYIEVSPIVGYRITEDLTAGLGFTYQYFKFNYDDPSFLDYEASVTGAKAFAQYDLFFGFFAHTEYEYDWYKFEYEDVSYGIYEGSVPSLFVGAGYNYSISNNARFQIMALYDVLYQVESLHYSPWVFRVGFNVGL